MRNFKVIGIVLSLVTIILLSTYVFYVQINNFHSKPKIEPDDVMSAKIRVCGLFLEEMIVYIDNKESVILLLESENYVNSVDGKNFLIKAKPWLIEYQYILKDGSEIVNLYEGQKSYVELQKLFSSIPEIKSINQGTVH